MVNVVQTRSEGHILKLVTGGVPSLTQKQQIAIVTARTYNCKFGAMLNHCLRECQSQNAGVWSANDKT
jgi:hypothetical protein